MVHAEVLDGLHLIGTEAFQQLLVHRGVHDSLVRRNEFDREELLPLVLGERHGRVGTAGRSCVMAELAVVAVQGLAISGKGSSGTYSQKDGEADTTNVRRHKNLLSTSEPEISFENQFRYFLVAIFSNYIYPSCVGHAVIHVTYQWSYCPDAGQQTWIGAALFTGSAPHARLFSVVRRAQRARAGSQKIGRKELYVRVDTGFTGPHGTNSGTKEGPDRLP